MNRVTLATSILTLFPFGVPDPLYAQAPTTTHLLVASLRDDDPNARRDAFDMIALSRTAIKASLPALLDIAKNPKDELYDDALRALSCCPTEAGKIAPVLLDAVRREPSARRIHLLARWGDRAAEVIPALVKVFRETKDKEIRAAILHVLGDAGPQSLPFFLEALTDEPWRRRRDAESMSPMLSPDYLWLTRFPNDVSGVKTSDVRTFAVRVLGRLGPKGKAAIPALEMAMRDEHHQVRAAATAALRQVRGEKE
jgi:hypothetical protein